MCRKSSEKNFIAYSKIELLLNTMSIVPKSKSRSSPKRGGDFFNGRGKQLMWGYAVVALVVSFILYLVARVQFDRVNAWARVPALFANPTLMLIFVFLSLLLAGYTTGVAAGKLSDSQGVVCQALFLGVGLLVIIVAYLTYRSNNFLGAFYLAILATVLLLVHMMHVYRVDPMLGLLDVPLLAVMFVAMFMLWYMADESSDNIPKAIPVYE